MQPVAERIPTADAPPEIEEARYLLPPFQVATQWGRSNQEAIQDFEQCLFLQAPDGRTTPVGDPLAFTLERPVHRVLQQAQVTCRLTGVYILTLKLRLAGSAHEWESKANFPIVVEDTVAPQYMFPNLEMIAQANADGAR